MRWRWLVGLVVGCGVLAGGPARAEFLVSSAIMEFTGDGPKQQDIELISRSSESDYIVTEVSEIVHPGLADEKRVELTDPEEGWLLVTPDKSILTGGTRKVLRFVLLKTPDEQEHIYRVAVKPVINEMTSTSKVGLKVLIGYEVLVIIRPAAIAPAYEAKRDGKILTVSNTGNTNVLLQNGKQCEDEKCPLPPARRVYPGETARIELPSAAAVSYSVWDGKTNIEKKF